LRSLFSGCRINQQRQIVFDGAVWVPAFSSSEYLLTDFIASQQKYWDVEQQYDTFKEVCVIANSVRDSFILLFALSAMTYLLDFLGSQLKRKRLPPLIGLQRLLQRVLLQRLGLLRYLLSGMIHVVIQTIDICLSLVERKFFGKQKRPKRSPILRENFWARLLNGKLQFTCFFQFLRIYIAFRPVEDQLSMNEDDSENIQSEHGDEEQDDDGNETGKEVVNDNDDDDEEDEDAEDIAMEAEAEEDDGNQYAVVLPSILLLIFLFFC
jgi:hypothetical protein